MKILVLDDDEDRHIAFKKMLGGYYVIHCYNYDDVVEALEGSKFDLMFLDHDLEDFEDEKGEIEITGVDVAEYIISLSSDKFPNEIIIHSWNPDGAKNMESIFRSMNIDCKIKPFGIWVGNK